MELVGLAAKPYPPFFCPVLQAVIVDSEELDQQCVADGRVSHDPTCASINRYGCRQGRGHCVSLMLTDRYRPLKRIENRSTSSTG